MMPRKKKLNITSKSIQKGRAAKVKKSFILSGEKGKLLPRLTPKQRSRLTNTKY